MPKTTSFSEQQLPVAQGPCVQSQVPAAMLAMPATIAGNGSITSGLISSDGYQKISVGLLSDQNGSLSIIRYLDDAGTIAQTAATPVAVVGGTAALCNVTDGLPFACFKITLTNTSGTIANVSKVIALLQSQ